MKYTFQDYEKGLCGLEEVGNDIPERTQNEDPNMASFVKSALLAVGGEDAIGVVDETQTIESVVRGNIAEGAVRVHGFAPSLLRLL